MSNSDFYKRSTLTGDPDESEGASMELPSQIGPYKIESLLNRGGSSLLYLGLHPETHEPITIKVLSPRYLSHPEMIDRFLKEAKIIALASHPNIIKLYGEGQWEGGLYIAMEFVQGLSLRQLILQNSLSLRRALEIVMQIAYALAHLHAHGVIHRDLKPENILLTETGGIKVIDFGIAQLHSEEPSEQDKKRLIGTPVYMSPEQKENPLAVSFASDIYALGIITYELVLGKLSHGSVHISLMPRGLQKILRKALQPSPKERYQDIVDFIHDLSAYLKSEEIEKELKGKDSASRFIEELEAASTLFLPASLPPWPKVEIGFARHWPQGIASQYFDFFEKDGTYSLLLAEPSDVGSKGMLALAMLRGIVRSLFPLQGSSDETISKINRLLCDDALDTFFLLFLLRLDPMMNQLHFLSCGFGSLWHLASGSTHPRRISSDSVALGIDTDFEYESVRTNWQIGDVLILHPAQKTKEDDEMPSRALHTSLMESLYLAPQRQAETLLRKLVPPASTSQRPLSLLSIQRIN